MKPLQTLAHCAREYPLLTMVGVYTALYTAGALVVRTTRTSRARARPSPGGGSAPARRAHANARQSQRRAVPARRQTDTTQRPPGTASPLV